MTLINKRVFSVVLASLMLLSGCVNFGGSAHENCPRIWFCDSCKIFNSPNEQSCKGERCSRRRSSRLFWKKTELERCFEDMVRDVSSSTWCDELPSTFDTWLCATCQSYNDQNICAVCTGPGPGVPAGKKALQTSLQAIVTWLKSRWEIDESRSHFSEDRTWVCGQCNYFNNGKRCKHCSTYCPRSISKQAAAFMQYAASAEKFFNAIKTHHKVLSDKAREEREKEQKKWDNDWEKPRPWFCIDNCKGPFNASNASTCKTCKRTPSPIWEKGYLKKYCEEQVRALQSDTSWLHAIEVIHKHKPDRHWLCVKCKAFNEANSCHFCHTPRCDNSPSQEAKVLLESLQVLLKWLKKECRYEPRSNDLWICNECKYFHTDVTDQCKGCLKSYTQTESNEKQARVFVTYAQKAAAFLLNNKESYENWLSLLEGYAIGLPMLKQYMAVEEVSWKDIARQWEEEGDIYIEAFLPCSIKYHTARQRYLSNFGHKIVQRANEALEEELRHFLHIQNAYIKQEMLGQLLPPYDEPIASETVVQLLKEKGLLQHFKDSLDKRIMTLKELKHILRNMGLLKSLEKHFIEKAIQDFDQHFIVQPLRKKKERIYQKANLLHLLQQDSTTRTAKKAMYGTEITQKYLAEQLIKDLVRAYDDLFSIGLEQELTQDLKIVLYLWPEVKKSLQEVLSTAPYLDSRLGEMISKILTVKFPNS